MATKRDTPRTRKALTNTPLCALEIGLTHYVMPMSEGLKVMAAMTKAVQCKEGYEDGYIYTPDDTCRETSIKTIQLNQLREPRNDPAPLALRCEPLKLPR